MARYAPLTSATDSGINNTAAVAATRGDLGQLAPRKKLLKSFSSFPEDFLRPSEHFGTGGGFSFFSSALPESNTTFVRWLSGAKHAIVLRWVCRATDLSRSVAAP